MGTVVKESLNIGIEKNKAVCPCSNSAKKQPFKNNHHTKLAMEERTLILIKPEGVQQGLLAKINTRLAKKGLEQVAV